VYILYLDESGTHSDARHFCVAGIAVHEFDTFFLANDLDSLQVRYFGDEPTPIPFHVAQLRGAHGQANDPYPQLNKPARRELIDGVYAAISRSQATVFAVAMEKSYVRGDCYERGFEEIVNRFDRMLQRVYQRTGNGQRGLIVAAESSYRENLEVLAAKIARDGHRWGRTRNLADIPYFAPASNTRLLQVADFVANAVYGRYENGYTRDFDRIASRFDQDGPNIHGLVHLHQSRHECFCPACLARRNRPQPSGTRLIPENEQA
jgi:hypothetical protein